MTIAILEVGTGQLYQVATLNPHVDPELADREAIPFSSAGFNRAPIFRPVTLSLYSFIGQEIQLVFLFDTVDHLYNGFRGWIVDNVKVTGEVVSLPVASLRHTTPLYEPTVIGVRCPDGICITRNPHSKRR